MTTDIDEGRLLEVLNSYEPVRKLRSESALGEVERRVLAIPPEDIPDNLTVGTLGPGTAACAVAPMVVVSPATKAVYATFHIGKGLTGHKGFTHGGAIAMILDECCGRASVCQFIGDGDPRQSGAVTAQLSISYTAPVPTDSVVLVEAVVDAETSKGRKANSTAKLFVSSDKGKLVHAAEAKGLFINPVGGK